MAMGYEIAVTPLQLAAAYVALANDGELLEPALVKEVRAPDGHVLFRHERRVIRRVVTPAVARRVRTMLLGVVEGGTAVKADLGSFSLAGKTGTARRTVQGRYAVGQHIPTFVGLFPAEHPQFVILVKLDNPRGAYVGGLTAAPVTKAVLEAALASRNASLDRRTLAATRRERPLDADGTARRLAVEAQVVRDSSATAQPTDEDSAGTTPFVALLPAPRPPRVVPPPPRAVPDIRGLPGRQAARALHRAGFHVQLVDGPPGTTSPAAGSLAPAGSTVRMAAAP
jgi:cell division protein FtsI (penicillin-binding protein 3)